MKLIFFILIFFQLSMYSQYSEEYKALIESVNPPIDSILVEHKYKNGKTKELGWQLYYNQNNQVYSFLKGRHYLYFKDGHWNEIDYDDFGNIMLHRGFDSEGNILYESKTKYITTTATNANVFFESDKHLSYSRDIKRYVYSIKLCKYYLKKEGEISNGRKSGTWKTYYPDGTLKKEKVY